MSYRFLSSSLHPVADAARQFFRTHRGVTGFKIEEPIDPSLEYRPTLSGIARDYSVLCIEVSNHVYTSTLGDVVLQCNANCLPVKLFVAFPLEVPNSDLGFQMNRAKKNGLGVVSVDESGHCEVMFEALSLSLSCVRPIPLREFPSRYRDDLSLAESTFRSGNPSKACAEIYDQLEYLTRDIAMKAFNNGWWATPPKKIRTIKKDSWATLITSLRREVDFASHGFPGLSDTLFSRIHGVTPYRNESGHKPSSPAQKKMRDRALRTRFESAADILLELVLASRKLR